ncbi:MAG: phosphoadenosine phosphosulfate reductase family protein, partial [Pseudomonadota bacterium]|nr:phosphoadenosine phosphosulfate reductase family protein [Pseudomonadota bacterium]
MSFTQKLLTAQQLLKRIAADHDSVAFANSLGAEDMVLMDIITKYAPAIEIFSIDTGRLPAETYDLIDRATKHYRRRITVYFPEQSTVENYVRINGINGFRDSVA